MPQRNNIIIARDRQAEGGRFVPLSAIVKRIKVFDIMLPCKAAVRRDVSFSFGTL